MTEALSLVLEQFNNEEVDIYRLVNESSSQPKWRFFVDAHPMQGWEHDCYVVEITKTVGNDGQDMITTLHRLPPKEEMEPVKVKSKVPQTTIAQMRTVARSSGTPFTSAAGNRTYALLIGGVGQDRLEYERWWRDMSFLYTTLTCKIGVPKDHITALLGFGNGYDWFETGTRAWDPSAQLDLDGDGKNEIVGGIRIENIANALKDIATKVQPGDHLLVVFLTEGGEEKVGSVSYTYLIEGKLIDQQFAQLTNPILEKGAAVNVVLSQACSDGFVKYLTKQGCVVTSATLGSQAPLMTRDYSHHEFIHNWTSAIKGATYSNSAVNADINGDGMISLSEAFQFARNNDYSNSSQSNDKETPQMVSTPGHLAICQSMTKPLMPIELYISTKENDWGLKPTSHSSCFWASPDLWIRKVDDDGNTCEIPANNGNSSTVYIKTRIGNRGWKPYSSGSYLHLYWQEGVLQATPTSWLGITDNEEVYSGKIKSQIITTRIAPGESAIITTPWNLSESLFTTPNNSVVNILASVSSSSSDSPTLTSSGIAYHNPLSNPGVARRTLARIYTPYLINSIQERDITLRNSSSTEERISLRVSPRTSLDSEFFSHNKVVLSLSSDVYNRWIGNGAKLKNISVSDKSGKKLLSLTSTDSEISDILLPADFSEKVATSLMSTSTTTLPPFIGFNTLATSAQSSTDYIVDLVQVSSEGTVTGGMEMKYEKQNTGMASTISVKESGTKGMELSVSSDDEILGWYDEFGNCIGVTSSIIVEPTHNNNKFTVVTLTSEQELCTGTVELIPYGEIKEVMSYGNGVYKILLTKATPSGMSIEVTGTMTSGATLTKSLPSGTESVELDLSSMPQDTYVIYVKYGNTVTESFKINR